MTLAAEEFESAPIPSFIIYSLAPAGIVAFVDETGEFRSPQAP